jgi:hypothetical protein
MRSLFGYGVSASGALAILLSISTAVSAQTAPAPAPARPSRPAPPAAARPADDGAIVLPSFGTEQAPAEAQLGVPIYPTAQFLQSYDAGRGQRIYLFGATAPFTDLVSYYRTVLGSKGDLVFERPATHFFETGRFRESDMAFTPGVTIKDFTGFGSEGYPNPRPGGAPARFPTVIQIVPAGPGDR